MIEKSNELIKFNNILACSLQNWYNQYKKITIKTYFIKLESDILNYLRDEIIILPKECNNNVNNDDDDKLINTINNDGYEDEDTAELDVPEFPLFSEIINNIIKNKLNGKTFIKTNWHCPKDAFWITVGQTLIVKDLTDFYQLLKASSICKEDLSITDIYKNDIDYFVILKKWKDIHPGTEFRCFVRNNNLIAISPRDWPQYHEHIVFNKSEIINDIVTIFKEKIKDTFTLDDYCFDVVRDRKDSVYLLDFSPFGKEWTDSLAFEWEQLHNEFHLNEIEDDPEFRYLIADCGIQPNKRNNYGIPRDIIDMFKPSSDVTGTGSVSLNDLILNFDQLQAREGL